MIICISTVTKLCSVFIKTKSGEYEKHINNSDMIVSLPQIVDDLLKKGNIELKDIKKIIISSGPGYFTAQRIGEAFAKGILCANGNAELIKLNSLDVLAYSYNNNELIIPILRAAKYTYNIAFFRKTNKLKRLSKDLIMDENEVLKIKKGVLIGEGTMYIENANTNIHNKKFITGRDMFDYYKDMNNE